MAPLALGTGPGTEERRSIAIVVIGGQSLSLLLTLVTTQWFIRTGRHAFHGEMAEVRGRRRSPDRVDYKCGAPFSADPEGRNPCAD